MGSSSDDSDSESDYSESSSNSVLSSDKEFGPERSQESSTIKMNPAVIPWVPTFKEKVDTLISRLFNDSIKFCTSGKLITPPITAIFIPKVAIEFIYFFI